MVCAPEFTVARREPSSLNQTNSRRSMRPGNIIARLRENVDNMEPLLLRIDQRTLMVEDRTETIEDRTETIEEDLKSASEEFATIFDKMIGLEAAMTRMRTEIKELRASADVAEGAQAA
jgi:uncharacterized protein YoxC